jgi:hypothetical protein
MVIHQAILPAKATNRNPAHYKGNAFPAAI